MKVFNDESVGPKAKLQVVLLLEVKEAQVLIEAMAAAVASNKRKKTWRDLYDKLNTVACY
jgi:hypothetical protein